MKTVMITCENDVMLYKDLIAKDIRECCALWFLVDLLNATLEVFQPFKGSFVLIRYEPSMTMFLKGDEHVCYVCMFTWINVIKKKIMAKCGKFYDCDMP